MSGRRSSSADGRPAGTSGGCGWSTSSRPRVIGAGKVAEQHADEVLLLRDAPLDVGDGRAGAEHQLLGLAHVDQRRHAAALAHLRQLQRLLARRQRPPRDLELQVERAQPEVGVGDLADDRRRAPRGAPTRWRAAAPAPPRWRGGTGPRNRAPRRALPPTPQRRGGARRRRSLLPRSVPPPAWTLGVDGRILVGARDAELRLRLQHPRGREPHVVVLRQRRPHERLQLLVLEHVPPLASPSDRRRASRSRRRGSRRAPAASGFA